MENDVIHRPHEDRGDFVMEREGTRVALMTYRLEDRNVVILHTEVDPSLRGQGAGARLVDAAAGWARREGYRLSPICSFAKSVIARSRDYDDVLA